ncbi:beta family protein [Kribbella deserti]|uniref:T4 beta protein n=1 Tax=Kribbella deserti TaxID=1926257 RepID=A0ABV6QXI6_9ACTN
MTTPPDFNALIALRAKQGELDALNAIEHAHQLHALQPLLELDGSKDAPASQLARLVPVVRRLEGLGRHVMVDCAETPADTVIGAGASGLLGELADELSYPRDLFDDQPVTFIPVVRDDASDARLDGISLLCEHLDLGAAVRVREPRISRAAIERILDRLRLDPSALDLIIDLRYLAKIPPGLIDDAAATATAFSEFGTFRSVTLLSGSVPPFLSKTSAWLEPRLEEVLWQQVAAASPVPLKFGDYGAVHPLGGPGFPSKHVSVKYARPAHWLFVRERMNEADPVVPASADNGPRARTFRMVCRHLVESGDFAGPDFSWGDRQIADAADGQGRGLGSTSVPVAYATSHHLAYLTAA